MLKYDNIVVGSGISGLTLAVILGMNGRRVLLLEKAPKIGGSMARFYKKGIPLDTGFHFTGAFGQDGLLIDMLKVLGIASEIHPVFLDDDAQKLVFEEEGYVFSVPQGLEPLCARLEAEFPNEGSGIRRFFGAILRVCEKTVGMDLRGLNMSPTALDEDYVSLETVLHEITRDRLLRAILGSLCMCHGVAPKEISFANHARVCQGLFQTVARVERGGDAFVRAFKDRIRDLPIDVQCKTSIQACEEVSDRRVGRFVLDTGESVACDQCIFTIHPQAVLDLLPKQYLRPAFIRRVEAFESSVGFFAMFGALSEDAATDSPIPSMVSLFPSSDVNQLLDPTYFGKPAMVIMVHEEEAGRKRHCVVDTLAVSFPEHLDRWSGSQTGNRPEAYYQYKSEQVASMKQRLFEVYPHFAQNYRLLDSASVLTFRDYLHSPTGSAYGIKQKLGQLNLFGQLPLRNIYAGGQSAVLPGVLGAMLSSFVVSRAIIGKSSYHRFVEERLAQ